MLEDPACARLKPWFLNRPCDCISAMGSFCDVVVAPARDAKKVVAANGNYSRWASCGLKGLSHVNFAVLHEILTTESFDDVLDRFKFLHTDESAMVQRIPDELVQALARLKKSDLAKVAKKWSRSEELEGYGVDDLQTFLEELTELARTAGGTPLLLCVSGF